MSVAAPTPADIEAGDELRIEYDPLGYVYDSHEVEAEVTEVTTSTGGDTVIHLTRPSISKYVPNTLRLVVRDDTYHLQISPRSSDQYNPHSNGAVTVELI